jgi:hypothetical protein
MNDEAKNCTFINRTTQGLCHSCLKFLLAAKKSDLGCEPLRRMRFKLKYLGELEVESETALGYGTGTHVGSTDENHHR